jgi:hypothetical protein
MEHQILTPTASKPGKTFYDISTWMVVYISYKPPQHMMYFCEEFLLANDQSNT